MEEWLRQLKDSANTLDKLKKFINVSPEEDAMTTLETKWGTTPYFVSLMDTDVPDCPVCRQVIPSLKEKGNRYGIADYLVFKENRDTDEKRLDSIMTASLLRCLKIAEWEEFRTHITDKEHQM